MRPYELKTNSFPMLSFVYAQGTGVLGEGVNEYEIYKNELRIALLRSVGIISNPKCASRSVPAGPPLLTPDLQCLGLQKVRFGLCFTSKKEKMFEYSEKFLNTQCAFVLDKQLDEKISNIFISIGIPAHIKGYQFLREAVKLAVEEPEIIGSITKRLYPTIAEKFETSSSKVERGMRHAIEVAWNRGKIENINSLFGLKIYSSNEKPTNGELIALIADKMIMEG